MSYRRVLPLGLLTLALAVSALPGQGGFELMPLRPGAMWTYRAGDQKVVVRVARAEVFEIQREKKEKAPGVTLEIVSGGRTLTEQVAFLNDGVYRLASADKEISPPLCFLKLPIKKGDTWTSEAFTTGTPLKGKFSCDEVNVKVPMGTFKAYTVTCPEFEIGDKKMSLSYWFVPNIGIVKQEVRIGNFEVLLELEKFQPGK
jgi:hypothetical protein